MKAMLSSLVVVGLVLGMAAPAAASDGYFKRLLRYLQFKVEQIYEVKDHETDWTRPVAAVPEPSSALVFGAGLLVASQIARRRRR